MENNRETRRLQGLDALRGIGITGIVLYHMFPSVFPGGFLGVALFFVLSGYLMIITSSVSWEKGKFHVLEYYRKRFVKLFPPLFAMVMAVCCYLTLFHRNRMAGMRGEICSIFLGYNNWWQIHQNASYFTRITGGSPFTHMWFLSIEMQLYLLWPLLFILYKKTCQILGGKKMCFLFLGLALLSAARMWYLYVPGQDPSRVYYGTDTMAFPLFIGMLLGAVKQNYAGFALPNRSQKETTIVLELSLLVICILFMTVKGQQRFLYQGGLVLISLFFAVLIAAMEYLGENTRALLDTSLLSLIGKNSYWIYLWHYPIIVLTLL